MQSFSAGTEFAILRRLPVADAGTRAAAAIARATKITTFKTT